MAFGAKKSTFKTFDISVSGTVVLVLTISNFPPKFNFKIFCLVRFWQKISLKIVVSRFVTYQLIISSCHIDNITQVSSDF